MKTNHWMFLAALVLGTGPACSKDKATDQPAAAMTEATPPAPAASSVAEPPATPVTAEAPAEPAVVASLGSKEQPGAVHPEPDVADAKGGSRDVVALGSGGKEKVLATAPRVLADHPSYKVTLAAPASVTKGASGSVTVEIVPKEGWKMNKEFPTKLTVVEPAGVVVSKKEQSVADAVAFADKSARWGLTFKADSAGAKAFTGVLKFAVCTDTSCDPKKEQLAWNVQVE